MINGPTNTQEQIDRLKERFNQETDPLYRALLEDKIKELYRKLSRESTEIFLRREAEQRERLEGKTAPIKCGLRNATGTAKPETAHWFWDNATEAEVRKLEKTKNKITEFLFVTPDRATVKKFTLLGGVKKTLREIGLAAIIDLPESVRKAKSEPLMQLILEKLNGTEKVPFC